VPELQSALERVVLHKIDGLKSDGPQLEKQFQVNGRPTFILMRSGGETVGRWGGFTNAHEFIENLSAGLQDPTTIEEKRARFASRPNLADAERLARFHETRDEYKDAVRYYREAQMLAAGSGRDFRFALFDVTTDGVWDGAFALAEAKQAADAALAYEGSTLDRVLDVAIGMSYLGQKQLDRDIMVPYLELAMRASEGRAGEGIQRQRQQVRVNLAEAEALARKAADLAREDEGVEPEHAGGDLRRPRQARGGRAFHGARRRGRSSVGGLREEARAVPQEPGGALAHLHAATRGGSGRTLLATRGR
jgi:hypothetical protein